jgi:hypothetical protein
MRGLFRKMLPSPEFSLRFRHATPPGKPAVATANVKLAYLDTSNKTIFLAVSTEKRGHDDKTTM